MSWLWIFYHHYHVVADELFQVQADVDVEVKLANVCEKPANVQAW